MFKLFKVTDLPSRIPNRFYNIQVDLKLMESEQFRTEKSRVVGKCANPNFNETFTLLLMSRSKVHHMLVTVYECHSQCVRTVVGHCILNIDEHEYTDYQIKSMSAFLGPESKVSIFSHFFLSHLILMVNAF